VSPDPPRPLDYQEIKPKLRTPLRHWLYLAAVIAAWVLTFLILKYGVE